MSDRLTGLLIGAALTLFIFEQRDGWLIELSNVRVSSKLVVDEQVPEDGFDTVLEAVVAASNRYNPDSVALDREHVGAILKCRPAGYFYTHGTGAPGEAPVTFAVTRPKTCKLAALWHTHGSQAPDRTYFSPEDTAAANALQRPIYMTNHTGRLYVYRPGQRTIVPYGSRHGFVPISAGTAEGTVLKDRRGRSIRIATDERRAVPLLAAAGEQ
jgi:hypothetical protein